MCSFGNLDLVDLIDNYLNRIKGDFDRKKIVDNLSDKFYQVMTPINLRTGRCFQSYRTGSTALYEAKVVFLISKSYLCLISQRC